MHETSTKLVLDGAIGTGALTTPIWLQHFQEGITLFMLGGGAVLLILRILIAIKELRKNGDK